MTAELSSTGMVLAAGLGKRMRPLTETKPKPLQTIAGRTMLDLALDKLVAAGISRAVVNIFYLGEQIETHLASRKDIEIILSREEELLDTGGGIAKALPYFEGKAFFCLNADLPWFDGDVPSLRRMKDKWSAESMDALLLVMKTEKALGFSPRGDFLMASDGRLHRKNLSPPFPYVMISAQILKSELFLRAASKTFSNNVIWDKAEERQRLYGLDHAGSCYHVGTPEDLAEANRLLSCGQGWTT